MPITIFDKGSYRNSSTNYVYNAMTRMSVVERNGGHKWVNT